MAAASLPRNPLVRRLIGKLPTGATGPAFSTLGANAAMQGAGLLGSILVARRYGLDVRGEYAGAMAWCALLSALSDWGVSQAVAYRSARAPLAPGAIVGTGLLFAAGAGTLGALFGLVAAFAVLGPRDRGMAMAVAAYLPSVPLLLVGTYASLAAQGLGLVRAFNAIRVTLSVTTLAGVAAALALGWRSGAGLMGAIVGAQALALLFALLLLHRHASARSWRWDAGEMRHLWGFGIQAHLGNLAWLANGRLDQLVMSVAIPKGDLGLYATAVSYAGLVFSLATATTDSGFAALAADLDLAERRARLGRAMRRIGRVGAVLAMGLAVAAPWLLPAAFGSEFRGAVLPAVVLLAASILLGLNYTLSVGLRAAGRPILTSVGEAAGLVVKVAGLPLVLIGAGVLGLSGIVGAAVLAVASALAVSAALVVLVRRTLAGGAA